MTYLNALKYINKAPTTSPTEKFPGEHIKELFSALGNPQRKVKYIRLIGNAGKTICAEMLTSILCEADISNISFTMPIYRDLRKNIKINGKPISMDELSQYVKNVANAVTAINKKHSQKPDFVPFYPTSNEIILCIFLLANESNKCNLAVVEANNYSEDSSKLLPPPLASVICGKIANDDKQSISNIGTYICSGTKGVVSSAQSQEIYKIITNICSSRNCRFSMPATRQLTVKSLTFQNTCFIYKGEEYSIPICGKFQITNALIVLETVDMLRKFNIKIQTDTVKEAFLKLSLPAKFEIISIEPTIIINNTDSIMTAASTCSTLSDFRKKLNSKITLCLSDESLVKKHISMLTREGFTIDKIFLSCPKATDSESNSYNDLAYIYESNERKLAKTLVNEMNVNSVLLVSGNINFALSIRYEILAILGFGFNNF